MDILRFELPYPPSVNHYYLRTANGIALSTQGRRYRRDVALLLHRYRDSFASDKRVSVTINVFPPDQRKRDLDNLCKAILDALEYANVYDNDNQIDMLTLIRRHRVQHGALQIWMTECSSSE